ncbi:alpha/beta fold hydrolase [Nocardia sp. SYP-A9097]|uniref:alpha/beta fold hydrolase n=1 Tax=Nocardia sp. SYP-A9097 TaxID=2663237 RepID=UPI00129AC064|nr:alpha/beta hydrolase [Nocardia sp. SYP-A9097]MRH92311.1 alpha/beta fold hydrolase [Nocardia sp. SYP-A9097]
MTSSAHSYTTDSVVSADGTLVGYRQFGSGPGCVLLHGALQASQNFSDLAAALSRDFTVYVPDRRGRGLSGPPGDGYCIDKDCEDVAAILTKTGAQYLFGLSSGAIIALRVALRVSAVQKVAIYEPPLLIEHPPRWMARYNREIARANPAAAFVTVLKGTRASRLFTLMPRSLLTPAVRLVLAGEAKKVAGDDVSLKELIPTMQFETHTDPGDAITDFAGVTAEVLLLGGVRSADYLRQSLDELAAIVPRSHRIEFPALDHMGPDNRGNPALVARELAAFFA